MIAAGQWLGVLAVLGVGCYTLHYARWAYRHGYPGGGAGLVILAGIVVALPIWLLFRR